ncbi:MAG TPA: hypothetical protein VIT22_07990 [Pseudoxanthomonas sp.]
MMPARHPLAAFLLTWIALVLSRALAGWLIPLHEPSWSWTWVLFSDGVLAVVACAMARRSTWRGWRLGAALALLPMAIEVINVIEAAAFLPDAHTDLPRLVTSTLLRFGLVACALSRVLEGGCHDATLRIEPPQRGTWGIAGRVILGSLAYAIIYFVAGMLVYPWVREFYAGQSLPSPGKVFALQLFVRGPVFVLLCWFVAKVVARPRPRAAWTVALLFAAASGVAPLLIPNPYFPDAIRAAHFVEVVCSNLLFGALMGALWSAARQSAAASRAAPG